MSHQDLLSTVTAMAPAMLDRLRELVEQESPTSDKALVDRLGRHLKESFEGLGGEVSVIANERFGDQQRVVLPGADSSLRPALICVHIDTVWSTGTLASWPFTVEDGKATGPGAYDMKASIVLVETAFRALRELGALPRRPVVLLLTSDEEVGSPTSRELIQREASAAEYVLVLEPPLPNGGVKTARKGVGRFRVSIDGRASHAGIEPEKGISAIHELANAIFQLHALTDLAVGTTVNVGVIQGGTRPNVVAAHAELEADVRAWTRAEAERIESAIRGLQPLNEGARITVTGGFNRPPMERLPQIGALYERARGVAADLGIELKEGPSGGASDGNFAAGTGAATLDGLGAVGDGAHADHEYVVVDQLPARAALLAALLTEL